MKRRTVILDMAYEEDDGWSIGEKTNKQKRKHQGYAAPFPLWWQRFRLKGKGYYIGEQHPRGHRITRKLKKEFKGFEGGKSVDLSNADIIADITQYILPRADFIFCMTVLEHTIDPPAAIRNMSESLKSGGLLSIAVPNNGFKRHPCSIDCYRFLEDSILSFERVGGLKLLDYTQPYKSYNLWSAIYRKGR